MFVELANSIIRDNKGNINEGAITTQETTEQVINVIKEIINGLSEKIEKFNQHTPLYQGQVDIIVNDINQQIKEKLKGKPVPIKFEVLDPRNLGNYDVKDKFININAIHFLTSQVAKNQQDVPAEEQRLYKLKDINTIDFEGLDTLISHELIHQQQDERSGGKDVKHSKSYINLIKKYDTNKNNFLDSDEIKNVSDEDLRAYTVNQRKEDTKQFEEILKRKEELAPDISDSMFLKRVKYLNTQAELNTWAKDTVQKFIKQTYDYFYNQAKQNNMVYNISADQMRNAVLAPFLNAAETNVFKNQPQQESYQVDPNQQPQQQAQQPQQQVQQAQQPQQQPQQSQNNQQLRNRLQQSRAAKAQQQNTAPITQDIKNYQTNRLLSLFPEYKFLTSQNKQKWWNYAYQILNKMKFKPFVTGQ